MDLLGFVLYGRRIDMSPELRDQESGWYAERPRLATEDEWEDEDFDDDDDEDDEDADFDDEDYDEYEDYDEAEETSERKKHHDEEEY